MIENVSIRKLIYNKDDVYEQFSRINNSICNYYALYNKKPNMIVMSEDFQYCLGFVLRERLFNSDVCQNKIEILFGINCVSTPKLKGLEFEVY